MLTVELQTARKMYRQKQEHFMKLTTVHKKKITNWYQMDRSPVLKPNGAVESVYKHATSKCTRITHILCHY